MIVQIRDIEYTIEGVEKTCDNCSNWSKKREFEEDHDFGISSPDFPQHHSCYNCKDYGFWEPPRRILYDIIGYLQDKLKNNGRNNKKISNN